MATADKLVKLRETKADIKAALIEKGQAPGDVFSTYPDLIREIQTGEGTTSTPITVKGNSWVNIYDEKTATFLLLTNEGITVNVSTFLYVENNTDLLDPLYVTIVLKDGTTLSLVGRADSWAGSSSQGVNFKIWATEQWTIVFPMIINNGTTGISASQIDHIALSVEDS